MTYNIDDLVVFCTVVSRQETFRRGLVRCARNRTAAGCNEVGAHIRSVREGGRCCAHLRTHVRNRCKTRARLIQDARTKVFQNAACSTLELW